MTRQEQLTALWVRATAHPGFDTLAMGDLADALGVPFQTLRDAQRNSYTGRMPARIYTVTAWDTSSLAHYARPAQFSSRRAAMAHGAQLARETAQSNYSVIVTLPAPDVDRPQVFVARWRSGRRVAV